MIEALNADSGHKPPSRRGVPDSSMTWAQTPRLRINAPADDLALLGTSCRTYGADTDRTARVYPQMMATRKVARALRPASHVHVLAPPVQVASPRGCWRGADARTGEQGAANGSSNGAPPPARVVDVDDAQPDAGWACCEHALRTSARCRRGSKGRRGETGQGV